VGLCSYDNRNLIIVSDTYNHKIKLVDPKTDTIINWFGSKKSGHTDNKFSEAQFNEPSGLSRIGDTIYVADTNNHCIRLLDGISGDVTTLNITEVPVIKFAAIPRVRITKSHNLHIIDVDKIVIFSNRELCIVFNILLPEGYSITFVKYQLWLDVGSILKLEDKEVINTSTLLTNKILLSVPQISDIINEIVSIEIVINYSNAAGLCKADSIEFIIPFQIQANLESDSNFIMLQHEVS